MASLTSFFASDLDVPGLPTKKRGMFSSIQMAIIITFSFNMLQYAMPSGNFISHMNKSCIKITSLSIWLAKSSAVICFPDPRIKA